MGPWRAKALLFLLTTPAGVRTCHYSWWSDNPRPYLEAIAKASAVAPPPLAPGERIRAGIVTHHFLAKDLMVRFFSTLRADCSPESIILIGPNHFHHGSANISFSSLPWKTPFGVLETDQHIVQQVKTATALPEEPEAFTGEHSVGVLIPFVKYYFPHCRVVPILVDVNAQENRLRELRGVLSLLLRDPHVLVILSMDFSHDSTAAIADSRDASAQQAIADLDLSKVEGLNVDCRKGLWLLMASLRDQGHVEVHVTEHTNSARLTGNPNQTDVTSYFSVYFASP
jgi:AmmeMemoRadiSam system protein B